MKSSVKISIIIPVYNAEKYLTKCLDSIAQQTMKDFELVLINDGSTDSSQQIIDKFIEKNNNQIEQNNAQGQGRISNIQCKIKENAGQAAARNDGLVMANGEYIAFMDSDDYIEPDYLETLYKAAVEHDSEAVTCGYTMVDDRGNVIRKITLSEHGAVAYGRAGMYVVWCRLYKREFLVKNHFAFQEGGKIYEDVPYSLAAKFLSKNPIVIDYEGYYYVQRPGSTMSSGSVKSSRFPYEKMTEAVENSLKCISAADHTIETGNKKDNGSMVKSKKGIAFENAVDVRNRLEFEVLHFFAGFLFRYCRKADKQDINVLVKYASELIDKYFPKYYKNSYVGILKNKQQPLIDKVAVRVLVWTKRFGLLGFFTKLVTRI